MNRFRSAMQFQDINRRNAEIDGVRGMLFEALADYINPHLLSETCAAGQLCRLECSWTIEQGIVATYQVQNEVSAVSNRLSQLRKKIRDDALTVINRCESHDELDFLFPEISRIHKHDLVLLDSWHNHVSWIQSLPSSDLKLLSSSGFNTSEITVSLEVSQTTSALAVTPEQLIYKELAEKSHFYSLRDQLLFMFEPELRREYECYISQQAKILGYRTLVTSNFKQASDLTVANLYSYFNIRDESKDVVEEVIATAKTVRTQNARHAQLHLVNNQTAPVFCGFDFLTKTSISQSS